MSRMSRLGMFPLLSFLLVASGSVEDVRPEKRKVAPPMPNPWNEPPHSSHRRGSGAQHEALQAQCKYAREHGPMRGRCGPTKASRAMAKFLAQAAARRAEKRAWR